MTGRQALARDALSVLLLLGLAFGAWLAWEHRQDLRGRCDAGQASACAELASGR